jgi:serine/threonine protein kinase
MSLDPGTRIGPFEVVAPLGAGGMGEVYRAKDSRLKREVALKVLPLAVARDAERLARFQREAEVLAALNHPHIAQIYGIEEAADSSALVMELVDGDDLAQRITRGPIAFDDAVAIAKQLTEALAAAHDAGIIHRDLKPANIKVQPQRRLTSYPVWQMHFAQRCRSIAASGGYGTTGRTGAGSRTSCRGCAGTRPRSCS